MKIISVKGIVVNTTPFKETSKIINIFTENMGIIGAVSKGCKKLKSKLRLASEKYAYGTFHLYYNEKGLSTLIDSDIDNYFLNIKSDILKYSYLGYICELGVYTYKESENNEVYTLLENSIIKIEEGYNPMVITNILEIQYLNYLGINLNLDECVKCGSSKIVTLSMKSGGYICSNCRKNEPIIDEKVIKLLRLYYYVDISKITSLDIEDNTSKKINNILCEYYDEYSGIKLKSKKFLREVEN